MIIGLILTYLVHKGDKIEITIPLFYELNQEASEKFSTTQKVLENLCSLRTNLANNTSESKQGLETPRWCTVF